MIPFEFSNISLAFALNPINSFFLLLLGIGVASVMLPMIKESKSVGFLALFALVVGGMAMLLSAAEFVSFFIGWEIMTWGSYLLMLKSSRSTQRGTLLFILFNLASAFLLLGGILLLYAHTGSFALAQAKELDVFTLLLFMFAFLIKIGTMPLHYWLPQSYDEAPDSFTPFLSALVSKMGVYGLVVLFFVMFPNALYEIGGKWLNGPLFGYVLAWAGVVTSIVATFKAISQDDAKRLLAYSSIAQVGYITTAIGVGSALALGGALFHALVHTVVKLLLFISIAGIVATIGKRGFSELGGLIYKMPISFFGVLIGIIGLAGMPPLPGFASKYLIYVSLLDAKWLLLLAAMILSSTAAFIYCYKLIYGAFLGHPNSPEARGAHEASLFYLIPQVALMLLLVGLGVFPGIVLESLINPMLMTLGLEIIHNNGLGELSTKYGGYDGVVLILVFGIAFAVIAALFFALRGKLVRADEYDIAYCGEVPDSSTPLHYGGGMGRELSRIGLVAMILKNSTARFYNGIASESLSLSGVFGAFYSGSLQSYILFVALLFGALLLFFGGVA